MQRSPLSNQLATVAQLETSGSQLDGISPDLEDSLRYASARLTQAAGILLRLPQEVIAQAIVILSRFWIGPEGGSLIEFGAEVYLQQHPYLRYANRSDSKLQPPPSTSPPSSPHTPSRRALL